MVTVLTMQLLHRGTLSQSRCAYADVSEQIDRSRRVYVAYGIRKLVKTMVNVLGSMSLRHIEHVASYSASLRCAKPRLDSIKFIALIREHKRAPNECIR